MGFFRLCWWRCDDGGGSGSSNCSEYSDGLVVKALGTLAGKTLWLATSDASNMGAIVGCGGGGGGTGRDGGATGGKCKWW